MKSVIIILVIAVASIGQVKSECFELVQQYYECKNLIMRNLTYDTFPPVPYDPNPWVANNTLNDTFYQNLNLGQMTLDQAMDLFRTIYNETYNCTSYFCKCVTTGIVDQYKFGRYNRFSLFFRNQTNFDQVKIILAEFIAKFQANLSSYDTLQSFFASKTHRNQNLSTLAQFCMKYDYTDERLLYYNDSFNCFNDDIMVQNCIWDATVKSDNSSFKTSPTNSDYEQLMSCDLIRLKNCPIEKQRFFALTNWAQGYPSVVWSGQSLKTYYDGLISQSNSYVPKIDLDKSVMKLVNSSILINNFKTQSLYNITASYFSANCLNASHFKIDCTWKARSSDYILSFVIFTFYDTYGTLSIPINTTHYTMRRRRSADEAAATNIYSLYSTGNYGIYEMFFLNKNDVKMHVFINTTQFTIYQTKSLWNQSTGVLVNGFDKSISVITTTSNPNSSNTIVFTSIYSYLLSFILLLLLRTQSF